MEYDFSFHIPTRIHFGREALDKLPQELAPFGPRVLLVSGQASARDSGLYQRVLDLLAQAGKEVIPLEGVPSNPTAAKVYEGIALARAHDPHLILALGGGSAIDCAKAVAAGALAPGDFWADFFLRGDPPAAALPVGVILTMVGTGSEMNGGAVITHQGQRLKAEMESPLLFPRFSLLDPTLTFSLPTYQMVSGICDVLIHILEVYLSPPDSDNPSDDLAEALLGSLIRNARAALADPTDYNARGNLMWTATLALSGLLACSKRQDWMVHQIQHQVAAYLPSAHGMGLAALCLPYYRSIYWYGLSRFCRMAQRVWGIPPAGRSQEALALAGLDALEDFFREIGACTRLRDLGFEDDALLTEIAASVQLLPGGYRFLSHSQVLAILREAL